MLYPNQQRRTQGNYRASLALQCGSIDLKNVQYVHRMPNQVTASLKEGRTQLLKQYLQQSCVCICWPVCLPKAKICHVMRDRSSDPHLLLCCWKWTVLLHCSKPESHSTLLASPLNPSEQNSYSDKPQQEAKCAFPQMLCLNADNLDCSLCVDFFPDRYRKNVYYQVKM